jgi:hypothetical protein
MYDVYRISDGAVCFNGTGKDTIGWLYHEKLKDRMNDYNVVDTVSNTDMTASNFMIMMARNGIPKDTYSIHSNVKPLNEAGEFRGNWDETYQWLLEWCDGKENVVPPFVVYSDSRRSYIPADMFMRTPAVPAQTTEKINHPSHYNKGKIEVIDFIEDQQMNFNLGNAVKYISRAGAKDPTTTIEDLKKAAWYVNREIQRLGGAPVVAENRSNQTPICGVMMDNLIKGGHKHICTERIPVGTSHQSHKCDACGAIWGDLRDGIQYTYTPAN